MPQMAALCVLLWLAGCTSTPPTSQGDSTTRNGRNTDTSEDSLGSTPIDINAFNQVRDVAYRSGSREARVAHEQLRANGLSKATSQLIDSEIAWLEGDINRAHALVAQLAPTQSASQQALLNVRISRAVAQQKWLLAAQWQADKLVAIKGPTQQDIDQMWEFVLRAFPINSRQRARSRRTALGPWLSLADAYQLGREAVLNWQQGNSAHLASRKPPSGMATWIKAQAPSTIATLLPLSGRLQQAGEALLTGMVSALYSRYPDATQRPRLVAIDTEMFDSIEAAGDEALAEKADIILGPLVKPRVSALARQADRKLPVIALNRGELVNDVNGDWLTLSLAPEDEAQQLSELAFAQGHRRAVFIAPDTDWGARMLETSQETWRQLGGTVVDTLRIAREPALSAQISQLVAGANSEERIKAVEDAFVAAVDARPRRRQDIDNIFMLAASPADARAIRPLLVYHFSGDLPVFAPSTINSGFADSQNRDLNGVTFVDIPAVLESQPGQSLARLEALGQDAVTLIEHWQQSLVTATPLLTGKTGLLLRQPSGDVRRILETATFDGGVITPSRSY